jgi:predicted deacylase
MKTTTAPKISLPLLALVALAILPSGGCGSSSNAPMLVTMFTYAPMSGPSPSVTTELGPTSTVNIAEIDVYATDVLDVLTAGFTLDYDPATVSFRDFDTAASHLASDGTMIQPFVQLTGAGQVTVGVTRLGATGIDFNGRQLIIRIRFTRVIDNGVSALTFGNNELLDSMTPPQPITGVQWFGGSFQVN